jgi:hypothetical protein
MSANPCENCGSTEWGWRSTPPHRQHPVCSKCEDSKRHLLTGTDLRRESLKEVEACVCKDRQNTYGDAEDNFAHIAAIASVVLADRLKEPLTALDVAAFSAAIKLARIRSSPHHGDNWTDLAGYAVCGAGIVKRAKLCESSSVVSGGSSASPSSPCSTGAGVTPRTSESPSAALPVAGVISTP